MEAARFVCRCWIAKKRILLWMLVVIGLTLLLYLDVFISLGCVKGLSCKKYVPSQISRIFLADDSRLDGYAIEDLTRQQQAVVQDAVSLNDTVLLILNPTYAYNVKHRSHSHLGCLYGDSVKTDVVLMDENFVHCKHPPLPCQKVHGSMVTLEVDGRPQTSNATYGLISWNKAVYSWAPLMDEGDVILFVKGLVRAKNSDMPPGLKCRFGDRFYTEVVAFCQENVRCKVPVLDDHSALAGQIMTIVVEDEPFPSVVRYDSYASFHAMDAYSIGRKPYYLCACTLVWSGAKFLKEWVTYHSHLGVQRFFIYDNNSDDDLSVDIEYLQFYNVSRHLWPWMKTQEASFSHCAVRAANECEWVAFIDLDEFIFPKRYLPPRQKFSVKYPPLHALLSYHDLENMGILGQLRFSNLVFGPSGLQTLPASGQMVNYICRLNMPSRVKSIVRSEAMCASFCSRVHYFELKEGFLTSPSFLKDAIIHHYKYQVWEDFKLKFVHRAATFLVDWQENRDLGSSDRTPGLGTQAIEPPDWEHQFCEVEDTELRDYVLSAPQLRIGDKLLWEGAD